MATQHAAYLCTSPPPSFSLLWKFGGLSQLQVLRDSTDVLKLCYQEDAAAHMAIC